MSQAQLPAIIDKYLPVIYKPQKKSWKIKEFVNMYREPVETYCITPNNAPEVMDYNRSRDSRRGRGSRDYEVNDFESDVFHNKETSDMLLNTINGLFSKFYAPERVRFHKDGIKVKLNDVVSYKVSIVEGHMKFYLTVPQKWAKSFLSSIKNDWGQVDITKVDETIVDFNPSKSKAMEVNLRHHYALSLKHEKRSNDIFYNSISSLASTMGKGDKLLIDYNISPTSNKWKGKALNKLKAFKDGKTPSREDLFTLDGVLGRVWDLFDIMLDEFIKMIEDLMGAERKKSEKQDQLFQLNYSDQKMQANTNGYDVQIRVLTESEDDKKNRHNLKNVETAFQTLNGDNKLIVKHIKTKRGIKSIIEAVKEDKPLLTKSSDIYFEKEMNNFLKLPSKSTLKEYKKVISQDNFTRTEIDEAFFKMEHGAIPFAYTLEKEARKMFFGGYERDWWTEKGRKAKDKTSLDDRSTATMIFGGMGSGKTQLSIAQALYTFGSHIKDKEQWKKESKSVVVFDVADGAMINDIYNRIQDWQRDRVVILNHSNFNTPIAVNNADLDEFNTNTMDDEDYAYTLAEMEAKLVMEILGSDKTMSVDRWFVSALQVAHSIDKDWGYIEAMRILIDDTFRQEEVIPKITNRRLQLEIASYNNMAVNGNAKKIIETIENRFSQLERDQKLWDCIAQKPLRDGNGKCRLNFRTMMDGDEDGAYLILIYIPKSGVSQLYRKFMFAHYFTKVWNVLLSREVGFGGREYRPETLIIMDEIHQIIDIPIVARLFIDIFKEPRKYSGRYWFTLHGWSSLAKAGRGLEGDIKQSIMDNGCNLIMLKGGGEAFESLRDFLQPLTIADFNNLMNMKFCGIFAMRWKNKNHVFQARMIEEVMKNRDFKKYLDTDSNFLVTYSSPYGRQKAEVREENLERSYAMIEQSLASGFVEDSEEKGGEEGWEGIEKAGMKERKKRK